MTVTTTNNTITYAGTTGQDTFAYDFLVDLKTDMNVYLDDILIDQSEWTMTGLGDPAGGDVILNTPLGADTKVVLLREVPETQLVDFKPYDAFPAETTEGALDKLTMITQQLQDQFNRINIPPPGTIPIGGDDAAVGGNLTVGGTLAVTGASSFVGGAGSGEVPVQADDLTRKDYVDTEIFDALEAEFIAFYENAYPAGSYVIGYNPNGLIPGVWAQLPEGTFIMNTVAGADLSGGSNDAVVISHSHTYNEAYLLGDTQTGSGDTEHSNRTGTTSVVGADGTGLNRPRYVGVEVWVREGALPPGPFMYTVTRGASVPNPSNVFGYNSAPNYQNFGNFGSIVPTTYNGILVRAMIQWARIGFTRDNILMLDGDFTADRAQFAVYQRFDSSDILRSSLPQSSATFSYDPVDDVSIWKWNASSGGEWDAPGDYGANILSSELPYNGILTVGSRIIGPDEYYGMLDSGITSGEGDIVPLIIGPGDETILHCYVTNTVGAGEFIFILDDATPIDGTGTNAINVTIEGFGFNPINAPWVTNSYRALNPNLLAYLEAQLGNDLTITIEDSGAP